MTPQWLSRRPGRCPRPVILSQEIEREKSALVGRLKSLDAQAASLRSEFKRDEYLNKLISEERPMTDTHADRRTRIDSIRMADRP